MSCTFKICTSFLCQILLCWDALDKTICQLLRLLDAEIIAPQQLILLVSFQSKVTYISCRYICGTEGQENRGRWKIILYVVVCSCSTLVQNPLNSQKRLSLALLSFRTSSKIRAQAEITAYQVKQKRSMSVLAKQQRKAEI